MEKEFCCQICSTLFTIVSDFKKHMTSYVHKQNFKRAYPDASIYWHRYTPWIFYKDYNYKGLSQMTLCFSSDLRKSGFYLCHICEATCPINDVVAHVSQSVHFNNYFAYTDPNALNFAWTHPSKKPEMNYTKNELQKRGSGVLQVLHLPAQMGRQCQTKTYRQVMDLLHQNKSLSVVFKEIKPARMSIQTYKDDANRKHPLLGLQHIVECVCVPPYEMKHYLCTLCEHHVSCHMIFRHLLSLDHLLCYVNKWHPSTLTGKEDYRNSDIAGRLTDLAKQLEKLHGLADIQQVKLERSPFLSMFGACFKDALTKIELVTNKRIWLPLDKPGMKLEPTSESGKVPSKLEEGSNPEPCPSGSSTVLPSAGEPSVPLAAQSHSLHCQNCSRKFETDTLYFNHLLMSGHQERFSKNFRQAHQCKQHLPLYNDFTKHNLSCVGVSLVMTILSHQVIRESVHVCLACEAVFLSDGYKQHMNSLRHLVQSLMYQNPWRLPFAWKMRLDHKYMKSQAYKEEEERGQQIIRILDVPLNLLPRGAPLTFSKVMEKLSRFHSLLLTGVRQRETFSKLQDGDRFPFLGNEFLVRYGHSANGWKFLCLLCQQTLSPDEYAGHVFSWDHVITFLDKYHPGSLDLDTITEEILLDLAKQAARIHRVSNEQEIEFDQSIFEVSDYSTKVQLLSAEKARRGNGTLMPCITPNMKLVPRQSQTQEKDRGQNTKATTGSDVVKNIHSNAKAPSEKAADGVQSANQVSCIHKTETMEISVQEKSIEPVQPERQTGEHELPNPSSPCPTEDVSAMERSYCLSDMDISDSGAEKEDSATARSDCGRMLWSYIQKKIREPLIGLSAVYECVHNNDAPIYLCDCCHCVIIEQHIVSHLTQAWHYKNYFAMIEKVSVLPSNNWRKEAVQWERSQGNGEAQIVELTSEEFGKLVSSSMYHEAISIVQKHLDMQEKKSITCVDTTTANSQKTAQQDVEMELDPEPVTAPSKPSLSTKTATNSKSKQDIMVRLQGHEKSITTTTATVSQCLTSTVTIAATAQSPTISSVCLLSSRKFSTNPTDVKNTITDEDASLKMEDKTPTVTPKPSKPLCKFIKARGVNPEAECKTANESIMFVSCTTIDTSKPNFKPICKFITSKSANRDTPAMTHLEPPPNGRKSTTATIPTSLNDTDDMTPNTQTAASSIAKDPTKETSCSPISDASNACKEAPNLQGVFTIQDKSISFDAMHKCKADSMPSQPASKVAPSGNNPLSCCVTTKTLEDHTKSTVNQLKLNINAETHIKKDGSVLKMDSLTPTTPNCDPQTWTTEASEKATTTNCPKVGLDQLLKVTCKESTHTYCFACLLILEKSNHLTSTAHQINCVKAKYPSWSGKPNETKLSDMVAQMAHDEKAQKITCKQIEVPPNVYKELKSLPDNLAIEKVKGMIEKKSSKKPSQRQPSAATRDMSSSPCSSPSSPCVSVSPCDVTSPGLGVENGKTKPLAKCNAEPIKILPISTSKIVQKPTSKVTPRILKGSTTDRSNLIRILGVMGRPVIGLSFVWECRVVPPKLPTFYLCESCHLTISVHEICGHMASAEHRRKYIMRQYPRFMYWIEEDLLPEMIDELMNDIAGWVWCREELMDAQTVLLSEECFERVRTAPFSEALHMVRRIKQTKTTALPLIVTSQHDVENQVEMLEDSRATDLDHTLHSIAGNSAESPTVSDNMPSPHITQLLLSPAQSPASAKQPDDILLCSAFNQNMSMSAKDEKKELLESVNEASANIPTPLSQLHNSKILITELSQNLLQQIPQNDQSISFVNQNLSSPKTKNQEHCEPLNKVGGDVSSPLSHDSAVGTPAPIDSGTTSPLTALKDTSINAKHETGIEDYMALEDAPQNSSGLTGESVSAIATSITDHNNAKSLALDSNVQNEVDMFQMLINLIKQNKNAANVEVSCTADSSESNVKKCQALQSTRWDTRSLPDTDTVPKEDSILNEDMTGTRVLIPKNNYLASGNGAPTSKENTEKPAVSSDLCKDVLKMMSSEMTVIQQSQNDLQETQVKTEETEIHEVKNKTKVQAPNEEDQPKELNIGAIDAKIQQSQVQTSQQNKPQLTSNTQMVPSQSPNQQRPICSLVSNRPKKNFKRENDYRQNISIMNANVQDSQGPSNTAATATVSAYPSNTMQVTGGYGHFDHTGYPTNTGCHSNMAVQNVHYSYSNAYLSQVYHHQQQAQYYTSMQPSIQNVQNPEVMEWFNPNTPLQPGAQTYAAVAGTNNVADLNTDTFNTANQNGTPTGWSY